MSVAARALVPTAFAASVERSIAFNGELGCAVHNTSRDPRSERLHRAWLRSGLANLRVSLAPGPLDAGIQAVLFHLCVPDVAAAQSGLEERGVEIGPIQYPFHAPKGEFRCLGPDGTRRMIMQGVNPSAPGG